MRSNAAVLTAAALWLVTTKPTVINCDIDRSVDPIGIQVEPSEERKPLTIVPWRTSFSQTGNGCVAPAMNSVAANASYRPSGAGRHGS
jgi:hypothetical protein